MDTLFDYIEHNNWEGVERHLNNSSLAPETALSLAEHALTHDRPHMLEELLRYAMDSSEIMFDPALRAYMDRKTSLAVKAMRFDKYECFDVAWKHLDGEGRYECLRGCVVSNREKFLKIITSKMDHEDCWKVLEYATKIPNPNILDHLLDVCPVPFEPEDIDKLDDCAPYISDTAMEVINLGWNNCLERILNLTPQEYDATEICVVACENENWEGARIALQFTTEDKVRAFNISFDPQMTQKNVGMFLCMLEDERLRATLTDEVSNTHAYNARRKL